MLPIYTRAFDTEVVLKPQTLRRRNTNIFSDNQRNKIQGWIYILNLYLPLLLTLLSFANPPFTHSCDFTTIITIKHDLKKAWIGANRGRSASKSSNLANRGLHYDDITRCWHASTTMLRRPLPPGGRVYFVYATLPLRHSRSYYDATQT